VLIPKIPRRPKDTPLTRLVRLIALVGVFALASVLYWHYYEHTLEQIQTKQSVHDQTKTLTPDQEKAIRSFAGRLKSRYGIDLQLKVTRNPVITPSLDPKTLFINICPDSQEVTVIFPPLVRSALGTGFEKYLATEHFIPFWQDDHWPQGLGSALALIGERLERLDDNDTTNRTSPCERLYGRLGPGQSRSGRMGGDS
jgi:hypothetical protein